jgi:hypothetical protein
MKLLLLLLACCASAFAVAQPSAIPNPPAPHTDPYTNSQWVPSDTEIAFITRNDWRILQAAVQQFAAEAKKLESDTVTFEDVKVYLRSDSRLYRSNGKDILGNVYQFSTSGAGVIVSPITVHELQTVPREYWAAP